MYVAVSILLSVVIVETMAVTKKVSPWLTTEHFRMAYISYLHRISVYEYLCPEMARMIH